VTIGYTSAHERAIIQSIADKHALATHLEGSTCGHDTSESKTTELEDRLAILELIGRLALTILTARIRAALPRGAYPLLGSRRQNGQVG
jgi:hypothetical protein